MAQEHLIFSDYIVDTDSVKHFGELKERLPLIIKIRFEKGKVNKYYEASEIIGLGDKLETRKLLIKYFSDDTSIVTKINTNTIKNTVEGIKELVNEYINAKLGKLTAEVMI